MLVVTRFEVPESEGAAFLPLARAALAAFSARPGYLRGRVGRSADDPTAWVLSTEWEGVGAYRRSLSSYDVKVDAAPLLSRGRDEPSAFEVLLAVDGPAGTGHDAGTGLDAGGATPSGRAADAGTAGVGTSSGPAAGDL